MPVFIVLTLFFTTVQFSYAKQPVICHFHLNKSSLMKTKSIEGVKVKTFAPTKDQTGKEAFERMVKDGGKCDGLIISGHHVGHFFDEDSSKKLFLEDIEKFSCDSKYKNWFNQVKSLWLLGCNTVADKYIKASLHLPRPNKSADSETTRLLRNKTDGTSNILSFQHSFSDSLDEFSPLSSRYLRAFSNTKIYGFNNAAPTQAQKTDAALIKSHIVKLTAAIKKEEDSQKQNYATISAIEVLFSGDTDYCDESKEVWEDLYDDNSYVIENQDFKDVYKLGCKLMKQKQILNDSNSSEKEKNKAKKQILKILTKINKNDKGIDVQNKYSHLLFNNIHETWLYAKKTNDTDFQKKLASHFKTKSFTKSLEQRIDSPFVGTIKIVDMLKFYHDLHKGDSKKETFVAKKVNRILTERVDKMFGYLIANIRLSENTINDENRASAQELTNSSGQKLSLAVIDQLSQYDLLTEKQIKRLLKNKKIFSTKSKYNYGEQVKLQLMSKLSAK